MKASEYFKKHGYKKCKAACAQNGWLNTGFWIQLKRLVESHELVEEYGGLDELKEFLSTLSIKPDYYLKKAILDVESCQ